MPPFLRSHVQYLCRVYTDPSPPLHLADRLLADLKVTNHVALSRTVEVSAETTTPEVKPDPDASDLAGTEGLECPTAQVVVPLLKKPGKKAARWIAETSQQVKFLMTRVARPSNWNNEVRGLFFPEGVLTKRGAKPRGSSNHGTTTTICSINKHSLRFLRLCPATSNVSTTLARPYDLDRIMCQIPRT